MPKIKFFPVSGVAVQLSLTSGHTAVVEPEGTELDDRFHAEAVARNCIPETMALSLGQRVQQPSFNRKDRIVEVLKEMALGEDPNAFHSNGNPNKLILDQLLGFTSDRNEVEEAWEIAQAQLDEEAKEDDEGGGEGSGEGAEVPGAPGADAGTGNTAAPIVTAAELKAYKKADLHAFLTKAGVPYETDANVATLRKQAEEYLKAAAK